jgi:hypothetical protein
MTKLVLIAIIIVVLLLLFAAWSWMSPSSSSASPMAPPMMATPAGAASVPVAATAAQGGGYPGGLAEGAVVRCAANGAIFRLEGGQRRHYPSWEVYVALGKPASQNVDCALLDAIPTGAPMSR